MVKIKGQTQVIRYDKPIYMVIDTPLESNHIIIKITTFVFDSSAIFSIYK